MSDTKEKKKLVNKEKKVANVLIQCSLNLGWFHWQKIFKMDYLMMIMESLKLSLKNIKQFYVKLSTPHGFGF